MQQLLRPTQMLRYLAKPVELTNLAPATTSGHALYTDNTGVKNQNDFTASIKYR
jgi:hypothetical protein